MRRFLYILLSFLFSLSVMGASKKFVLVIDAGHGGRDAGAVGSMSKEKNINLKVALAFGGYVERNCDDVKVIYTRKTDTFLELYERADIANKNHANVFISIHTNSLPGGHISRGVETYSMTLRRSEEKLSAAQQENSVIIYEKDYEEHYAGYDSNSDESSIMFEVIHDVNMEKSVELSKCIQKNICATANRPDKGVRQDNFHVLRRTSMPACLVELGFISTPDEERLLNNDDALDSMAFGIYKGFLQYKSRNDVSQDVSVSQPDAATETPSPKPVVSEPVASRATTNVQGSKPEKPAPVPSSSTITTTTTDDAPVFKVQIATGPRVLKNGDPAFKGIDGVSHYKDGGTYKFTIGEYDTFSAANARKREVVDKFPGAFVVAFRNGERMDINEARNYRKK